MGYGVIGFGRLYPSAHQFQCGRVTSQEGCLGNSHCGIHRKVTRNSSLKTCLITPLIGADTTVTCSDLPVAGDTQPTPIVISRQPGCQIRSHFLKHWAIFITGKTELAGHRDFRTDRHFTSRLKKRVSRIVVPPHDPQLSFSEAIAVRKGLSRLAVGLNIILKIPDVTDFLVDLAIDLTCDHLGRPFRGLAFLRFHPCNQPVNHLRGFSPEVLGLSDPSQPLHTRTR